MKKLSKKLLAVLLSLLMVASMAPLTAFAAPVASTSENPASDAAAVALWKAIEDFEAKFTGKIYNDMGTAYAEYVKANAMYDAYVYGGASVDLAAETETLNGITENLTEWTGYTGTAGGDSDYYKNLLYLNTSGMTTAKANISAHTNSGAGSYYSAALYYPVTTMLYDGKGTSLKSTITFTASGSSSDSSWTGKDRPRYIISAYSTNTTDLLPSLWKGTMNSTTVDPVANLTSGGQSIYNLLSSTKPATWDDSWFCSIRDTKAAWNKGSDYRSVSASATWEYKGTLSALADSTDYYAEITPTITLNISGTKTDSGDYIYSTGDNANGTLTGNAKCYVVNYARLITAANSRASQLAFASATGNKYRYGGAAELMNAYQAITSFDPNTYFTKSNDVDGCQKGITDAIAALLGGTDSKGNTVTRPADPVPDSNSAYSHYEALKTQINARRAEYIDLLNDHEGLDTWDGFAGTNGVWTVATNYFINLVSTGYKTDSTTATNGNAAAIALRDYVLFTNRVITNGDEYPLEELITQAQYAINNKSYFTTASFSSAGLATAISNAKKAVWGSVANYLKSRYALAATPTSNQTTIVQGQIDALKAALAKLVINSKTAVVDADNYSLDAVIKDCDALDYDEFANGQEIKDACTAAKNAYTVANASAASITSFSSPSSVVSDFIREYCNTTKDLRNLYKNRQDSFKNIINGATVYTGDEANVTVSHPQGSCDTYTTWSKNNNQILFRTSADAADFTLGQSGFIFGTSCVRDQYLDTISIDDGYSQNKELVSKGGFNKDWGDVGSISSYQSDIQNNAKHTASANDGASIYIDAIKISSGGNSNGLGTDYKWTQDEDGNPVANEVTIDTSGYNFTTAMKTVEKTSAPCLGPACNASTTYLYNDFNISLPANTSHASSVSASTLPTYKKYTASSYFGTAYSWGYVTGINVFGDKRGYEYRGYAHSRTSYSQTVYVIDVSYLWDLWAECESITEDGWTTDSYKAYSQALQASKSVSYAKPSNRTAEQWVTTLTSTISGKYTDLWNAKEALVPAVTNAAIRSAIATTRNVGIGAQGYYSDATWSAFQTAYNAATAAVATNGKYSDAACRNIETTDTAAVNEISAIAQTLLTAYNNLKQVTKLAAIYEEVENLQAAIELLQAGDETTAAKEYTSESIQSIADALANTTTYPLLNTYANGNAEIDYSAANETKKANEIKAIKNLKNNLVVSQVDESVYEATKLLAESQIDPDSAINYTYVKELISNMKFTDDVQIFKGFTVGTTTFSALSVQGVNYETQVEADSAPYEVLEQLTPQTYTLKLNGNLYNDGNHADGVYYYGEEVTVNYGTATGWNYTYSSTTSNTDTSKETYSTKYLGRGESMTIVIKGNTELTTVQPKDETKYAVKFVMANTGRVYDTQYVTKGESITIPEPKSAAFYTFTGYKQRVFDEDAEEYVLVSLGKNAGDEYQITDNTTIYADYAISSATEADSSYFLYIAGIHYQIDDGQDIAETVLKYGIGDKAEVASDPDDEIEPIPYNTKIDITQDGLTSDAWRQKHTYIMINGQKVESPKAAYRWTSDREEIVAWLTVPMSKYDTWVDSHDEPAAWDTESIIHYGSNYTFYINEDTFLIPVTQEQLDEEGTIVSDPEDDDITGCRLRKAGLDENNALVTSRSSLVDNNTKFSMIGTFAVPDDARFIEAGMLFTSGTDISSIDTDLSLSKAGTNNISRLKSSKHTAGNQYVISMKKDGFTSGTTVVYLPYVVYEKDVEKTVDGTKTTVKKQFVQYGEAPVIQSLSGIVS